MNQNMTAEQATQVLMAEEQKNKQECWRELQGVLIKFGFQFDINTVITSQGRIIHQVDLVRPQMQPNMAPPAEKPAEQPAAPAETKPEEGVPEVKVGRGQ